MRLPFRARRAGVLAATVVLVGCIISTTTRHHDMRVPSIPTQVQTAFRAHLRDGSMIAYPRGALIGNGRITGSGTRFDATRKASSPAQLVTLDSVLGLEIVQREVNPGRTAIYLPVTAALS